MVDIVDLVAIKFDWFGRTLIIIIIILLCYCAGLNRIHIRLEGGRQAGREEGGNVNESRADITSGRIDPRAFLVDK